MDKNIPLSQLIRIGAKLRPQGREWTINEHGHTCALGAAYMAKFGEEPPRDTIVCRKSLGVTFRVAERIILMNDNGLMTREEIAQHLEEQGL